MRTKLYVVAMIVLSLGIAFFRISVGGAGGAKVKLNGRKRWRAKFCRDCNWADA